MWLSLKPSRVLRYILFEVGMILDAGKGGGVSLVKRGKEVVDSFDLRPLFECDRRSGVSWWCEHNVTHRVAVTQTVCNAPPIAAFKGRTAFLERNRLPISSSGTRSAAASIQQPLPTCLARLVQISRVIAVHSAGS